MMKMFHMRPRRPESLSLITPHPSLHRPLNLRTRSIDAERKSTKHSKKDGHIAIFLINSTYFLISKPPLQLHADLQDRRISLHLGASAVGYLSSQFLTNTK